MDDCSLNKVNSAKYLGVIIDDNLNWIDHIVYIKNIISNPVFNNGLKPPCLAEQPLSHLLSRVAEPTGLSC